MSWSFVSILLLLIVPACSKSPAAVTVDAKAGSGIKSDHTLGMPPADSLSLDEIGCAVDEDQP